MTKKDKDSIRAISLFSGGLDSALATKVVMSHGVDVVAIRFDTGFFKFRGRGLAPQDEHTDTNDTDPATKLAAEMDVPLRTVNIVHEYLEIVTNPSHGYGRNVNPCIDCKIMMLRKAKEMMAEIDANFVVTGEVLGQRPMSQHLITLNHIEKESDLRGLLLRPLSAKLLRPTIPELNGWVDRDRLFDFSGRSRKPQIKLAEELGIHSYAQPAGGCFLTDENYARRLNDLFEHKGKGNVTVEDVRLAMVGRQFRISNQAKAAVGRDEVDNDELAEFVSGRWSIQAIDYEGPLTIVDGAPSDSDLEVAARITARYCDGKNESSVRVKLLRDNIEQEMAVHPIDSETLESLRL